MSKIWDTTRTVFFQGPSIVLLVWISIMFNHSFLRVCRILQFVKKLDFSFLSLGGPSHGARVWCLGRAPKHRNHCQEVEGLLFSPKNSQLVYILSFHSQGVVFLFIFATGPIALDSEPRGRRQVENMIYNRNRLYSRAIHCPASMEMHYVQWFLLQRVLDIARSRGSGKKQGAVARSRGLVIQPPKLSVGVYFELSFLECGFLIHLSNRSDSPRFRAKWKKIRQKYGTRQEPSLFKGHPFSYMYGEALCSMVPS